MSLNRSPEEVLNRIERVDDMFGFKTEVLVSHLPYEHAEEYLKDGVTEEEWEQERDPMGSLRDYMEFAAKKARGERSNSATRSVQKMEEWLWLAGRDELLREFEDTQYRPYGKPKLRLLADRLGMEVDLGDN